MKTKTVYKSQFNAQAPVQIDEVSIHWNAGFDVEMEGEGCTAKALVSRPIGNGNRRLETFSSSGLWGIDERNQQDEEYQLENLREHLQAFGVPWYQS